MWKFCLFKGSPSHTSRRKKMWNSFKKSAKRFRSRSREKLSRSKSSRDDPSRLSARWVVPSSGHTCIVNQNIKTFVTIVIILQHCTLFPITVYTAWILSSTCAGGDQCRMIAFNGNWCECIVVSMWVTFTLAPVWWSTVQPTTNLLSRLPRASVHENGPALTPTLLLNPNVSLVDQEDIQCGDVGAAWSNSLIHVVFTCFSQPDISPNGTLDHPHQTDRDFETLFDAAQQRNASQIEYVESGERSFSDPSMIQENGLDRSRSEEKESEVDSGIAVVEHSVSTVTLFSFYLPIHVEWLRATSR